MNGSCLEACSIMKANDFSLLRYDRLRLLSPTQNDVAVQGALLGQENNNKSCSLVVSVHDG